MFSSDNLLIFGIVILVLMNIFIFIKFKVIITKIGDDLFTTKDFLLNIVEYLVFDSCDNMLKPNNFENISKENLKKFQGDRLLSVIRTLIEDDYLIKGFPMTMDDIDDEDSKYFRDKVLNTLKEFNNLNEFVDDDIPVVLNNDDGTKFAYIYTRKVLRELFDSFTKLFDKGKAKNELDKRFKVREEDIKNKFYSDNFIKNYDIKFKIENGNIKLEILKPDTDEKLMVVNDGMFNVINSFYIPIHNTKEITEEINKEALKKDDD